MKRVIVLFLLASFLFSSCATTSKKCDGSKKIKSSMW